MTEEEWLACRHPATMLEYLNSSGKASHRKLRLHAVACCRRVWHLIEDEDVRKALGRAERYADELIKDDTVLSWSKKASKARDVIRKSKRDQPGWLACHVVSNTTLPKRYLAYLYVHREVAQAIALDQGYEYRTPEWDAAIVRENEAMCESLRDIVGDLYKPANVDPAWLVWNDRLIPKLARGIFDELSFDRMPILGDALEEAGCTEVDILDHCRANREHVRGCWVVDIMLGRS